MGPHISPIDLAVIAAYLAFMLGVGALVYRRVPDFDDFFLAGRLMTTPILICTLVSTFYGVDVLFGTSELAYEEGVVAWFSYSRPTYLFLIAAAFLLAPRLHGRGFRTLPDVLAHHYGRGTQVVAAAASFVYALPSLGLFGLGHAFSVLFGWEPWVGALVFGGATLVYTLAGGLLADALTDTVQFVMMCVTLGLAVPAVLRQVGGFASVEATLGPAYFEPLGTIPGWLVVVYASTGLVVFVEPSFYQRVFAARSAREVRHALLIGILLWAAYDWSATAGGMLAAAAEQKGLLGPGFHANEALLRVVTFALPAGLTGVFMAGVLACEMSTIDSYCLVAGGNVAYDIYRPLRRPGASPTELLRWTRAGIGLSWGLGFLVAFLFERLLALWVFLATVLTATTLVPVGVALVLQRRLPPAAGFLSATAGLGASVAYYATVWWLGIFRDEVGSFVWTVEIAGAPAELRQEYAMLVSLPLSALGFAAGMLIDRWRRARS